MSYYSSNSSNLAPQSNFVSAPSKMNFNYPNSNNLNSLNSAQNNINPTNNLGNNFIFPQSQGNVYFLNTAQEINNIPIANNGVSIGLALQEGVLYLKAMQNGNIILNGYKLSALEQINQNVESTQTTMVEDTSNNQILQQILDRLEKLEALENKKNNVSKGGGLEW